MNIVKDETAVSSKSSTAEAMPFGRDALDTLLDLAEQGIGQLIEKTTGDRRHLVPARSVATLRDA